MDKSYDPELGQEGDSAYRNDYGNYVESEAVVACVRFAGVCCWVFLGLVGFLVLVSYIPISGVTEAPAYARTLIYMSLGYAAPPTAPPTEPLNQTLSCCCLATQLPLR